MSQIGASGLDAATHPTARADDDFSAGPPPTQNAIPGYTLLREIHRGAQGIVYLALQHSTRREVAIKLLRQGPFAGPEDRTRFDREIQVLAQLKHPNIVTVHDGGVAGACVYFVMDYIPGQSLTEWIQTNSGGRPIREVLELFARICRAVEAAHAHGIIHRDLKPGNIRIAPDGQPHVLDFGLAKRAATAEEFAATAVTLSGSFMGTLAWASPEQADGHSHQVDARTDVYALGVLLFQMLTGAFPYEVTGQPLVVSGNIVHQIPVSPRKLRRDVPYDVARLVLRCLRKNPAERYANAGVLANNVERYLAGEAIDLPGSNLLYLVRVYTARWIRRYGIVAYVLIGIAATLLTMWRGYTWIDKLTNVRTRLENAVVALRGPVPATLDHVRIIALQPGSDARALAAAAGLDPDAPKRDWKAMRAVHGRLMQRLAEVAPRVVVFNIAFEGDSPEYDDGFVQGVNALANCAETPCPVVVGEKRWSFTSDSAVRRSTKIAAVTRWGCTPFDNPANLPWHAYLARVRGGDDTAPSLPLAAFGAYRRPTCKFDPAVDLLTHEVQLVYWRPVGDGPIQKIPIPPGDMIRATTIYPCSHDEPQFGLLESDYIACSRLALPTDEHLETVTFEYGSTLAASVNDLRRNFAGRIVLIADQQRGPPPVATEDGRKVYNGYAFATAIEMLVANVGLCGHGEVMFFALAAGGAVAGVLLGVRFGHRHVARALLLLVLMGADLALCLWLGVHWSLLYNPCIAALAMLLACEAAAAVRRVRTT